jgi:serine/threonine protein kinase
MSKELLSGDHDDLTKSDIFSLGATMYEICLGKPLPSDGPEWQAIRAGQLLPLQGTPFEMELIIKEMIHPDPNKRPSASQLLTRQQLLSDEQKQLMAEKSKVLEANLALALQTKKMKKLTPPPPKTLMRANTWNGSSLY